MQRYSAGIVLFASPIQFLDSHYNKQYIGQYLPAIWVKELAQDLGQPYQETEVLCVQCSFKSSLCYVMYYKVHYNRMTKLLRTQELCFICGYDNLLL